MQEYLITGLDYWTGPLDWTTGLADHTHLSILQVSNFAILYTYYLRVLILVNFSKFEKKLLNFVYKKIPLESVVFCTA